MMPTTDISPFLIERAISELRALEFRTFVVGFERPAGYDREAHEAVFRRLKVTLGSEISRAFPGTDADFMRPDVEVWIGASGDVTVRPAPVFIGGRYRKLSRSVPASRWIHHGCRGRGCPDCSFTGNLCGPSIEELLAAPALDLSGGERASFHALGREDTDARMLGSGRPFVLEVHRPRRRTLDLESLKERFHAAAAGHAEVGALAPADRGHVRQVKEAAAEKTYRAWVEVAGGPPPDAALLAAAMAPATIAQLSPTRVMRRRGKGLLRQRRLLESAWLGEVNGLHLWEVRVESGMYVKELVSGDGGRTRPSLAAVFGRPCRSAALDVLEVHWDPPWRPRAGPRRAP